MSVRKADSGVVDGGQPRVAEKKAKAPGALRFVCLLPVGGDSVEDLTRFLRREGAGGIEVSRLEPPAVREAFAAQRGRPGVQAEPSEGWMVTAELPSGVLPRLQEALAARTSLRVLQQPPLPAAPSDPSAPQRLNITVLR